MKKIILYSIFIIALSGTSCNSSEKKSNETTFQNNNNSDNNVEPSISDFTKTFEGTINGKYGIIMTLTNNSNMLNGTNTYKSQGSSMKISGTINANGELTLNEFNDKGIMTGIFKGQMNGNSISGQWSKPDGSKSMTFSISESSNSESSIAKSKLNNSEDYSNWTGIYYDEFHRKLKISGPAADGAVRFEITPQNTESCMEDIYRGTAYLTKSYLANFSDENSDCQLSFTFNPGSIEIMEYNCEHGASCGTYDGVYVK